MKKLCITLLTALLSLTAYGQRFPIGIISYQDTVRAFQIGALSSIVDGQMDGVQFGTFTTLSATPFEGMQLSPLGNISAGVKRGMQLSALYNVSSGHMHGLQMSFNNFADTLTGTQVGIVNVAITHPKGWQIGLVNYTRDTVAHKIGLVNVNPNTTIDYMLSGGSSTKVNAAVRFRNRSTYSIVGIGTHYMGLDRKFSGALFYRLGKYVQLSPRWSLSGDVGFYHIETFADHESDNPQRLYSLQARLNVDYQISKHIGAFGSVGWGDTRYYHHATRYRSRPLFELGITIRNIKAYHGVHASEHTVPSQSVLLNDATDSTSQVYALSPKARPWQALAEMTAINVGVHCFDRFVTSEEFAQTTLRSIRHNLKTGFVWDNDLFTTNLFAHPYHGSLYFNAARQNGLNFWQSAPYALGGSLMWELFGETEPPAINDIMATSLGGIGIGEVTHRLSRAVLDDRIGGFRRFLRETAATIINPIQGLHRIISGDAWHVRSSHYLYHDSEVLPIDFSISVGDRYLADNGSFFKGEHNPYINLYMEYGDALDEDGHDQPYDFFDAEVTVGMSSNQPLINSLHLLGRLWSTPIQMAKGMKAELGIYQHFNYYDSKPVKDGTDLTPYRISEAASVGPGLIFSFPEVGVLTRLEQRLFLSGIILGGTKSDYYNMLERDYNMGSGFSIKTKTHLEMRNFGRFILHAKFFQLYTWKGYEQKDLTDVDLHYVNAQGDRGNARLFVVTTIVEKDLTKNWSLNLTSSYFGRRTHYKYFDNVHANTFELRGGVTYHW
ncbi:MAG: DUF3943 domain-containing protein [Prevotella sp.]|nr:DUF3943 domain-containing protein [Prevotella sp.]